MNSKPKLKHTIMIHWLWLIVFSLPTYLIRFKISEIPTTLLEVNIYLFFIFLLLFYLIDIKTIWQAKSQVIKRWIIPVLLILAGAVIGTAVSPEKRAALGLLKAYFFDPLLILVGMAFLVDTKKDAAKLISAMGWSVIVIGSISVLQGLGYLESPETWLLEIPKRFTSVFEYPNSVSLYCLPVVGLFSGILLFDNKLSLKEKIFGLLTIALGMAAIYLAVSRGALLAAVLLGLIAGLFSKYRVYALSLVVILVIFLAGYTPMRERILDAANVQDFSTSSRLVMWEASVKIIQEKWLTGAGLAGFQKAYEAVAIENNYPMVLKTFLYPHNIFLNFWVIIGLSGLLGFFWAVISYFRHAKRIFSHREYKGIAGGLIISMAMWIVYGLVDAPYFKNDLAVLFWVIWALPFLLQKKEAKEQDV